MPRRIRVMPRASTERTRAFALYSLYRIRDRAVIDIELFERIAGEVGVGKAKVIEWSRQDGWAKLIGEYMMPCIAALTPTSTTTIEVIDEQRRKFLAKANDLLDQWSKNIEFLGIEFGKAKKMKNKQMAREYMRDMNQHALFLRRIQEISGHATCDSGSSLAPSQDAGEPTLYSMPRIYIAKEISQPRIPQLQSGKTIDLKVEVEQNGKPN